MMQGSANRKSSHAAAMLLFAFLSAFSAAATAVMPLIMHS
jgi:hypothetical protein